MLSFLLCGIKNDSIRIKELHGKLELFKIEMIIIENVHMASLFKKKKLFNEIGTKKFDKCITYLPTNINVNYVNNPFGILLT